jgi:hypothetical protein
MLVTVEDSLTLSVTVSERTEVPATVGVPVIWPDVSSERPAGRLPLETVAVSGAVPPVKEIVAVKAVPTVPLKLEPVEGEVIVGPLEAGSTFAENVLLAAFKLPKVSASKFCAIDTVRVPSAVPLPGTKVIAKVSVPSRLITPAETEPTAQPVLVPPRETIDPSKFNTVVENVAVTT